MRDKKVIILIVLGVGAIMSLIYGLTASTTGRKAAQGGEAYHDQERASVAVETVSTRRRAVRTKFTSWKRSPFIHKGSAGDVSHMVLSGIFSSGSTLKASINNTIVGIGSRIGDNTVVGIKKDRVILNDGVKNFELKLEQ